MATAQLAEAEIRRLREINAELLAALAATRPIISIHAENGLEGAAQMLAQVDAAIAKAKGGTP